MNWILIISFVAIIILCRYLIFRSKYLRTKFIFSLYNQYLKSPDFGFAGYKQEIIDLFGQAKIKDSGAIHIEQMPYGNYAQTTVSVMDNILSRNINIATLNTERFHACIGYFRRKYKESLSPLFWIEFITKFPTYLLEWLGVIPKESIGKIITLIYWIAIVFFVSNKYSHSIESALKEFLKG